MRKALLASWFLVCLAVLVMTIYASTPEPSDIGGFFLGAMIVLTFPAGLLVLAVVAILAAVFHQLLDVIPPILGWPIIWIAMMSLGYLQWFVIVPRLTALLLRRHKSVASDR